MDRQEDVHDATPLPDGPDRLPPALRVWLAALPSSGLFEHCGEGVWRLTVPATALAEHLGYSRRSGALSRRLTRLEAAGLLLSRRPLTVRVPGSGLPVAARDVQRSADPVLLGVLDMVEELARRGDLDALRIALLLARQLARCAPDSSTTTTYDHDSVAEPRRSLPVSSSPVWPLAGTPQSPVEPVGPEERTRVNTLLAPILQECDRRGLPGLTSASRLARAFRAYSDAEIRTGVRAVCDYLAAGAPIRSPVGLLLSLAESGDLTSPAGACVTEPTITGAVPRADHALIPAPRCAPGPPDPWLLELAASMRQLPGARPVPSQPGPVPPPAMEGTGSDGREDEEQTEAVRGRRSGR